MEAVGTIEVREERSFRILKCNVFLFCFGGRGGNFWYLCTYQRLTRGLSAAHSKNSEEIIDLHKIKACDASKTCGVASMFIFLKTKTFKIWLFFLRIVEFLK